ncbi:unnamed protein product, partial [Mesorhabditis spiculigera]
MSARSAYSCQIQGCNAVLILCGLAAAGLAGSQFSRVGIHNYRDIDLRILNWIHALTGLIGIYSIARNHGSIVTKTLYCVSIVIGVATAVFYGFTTYRIVDAKRNLQSLQNAAGFDAEFGAEEGNYTGRIVISAIMIGVPAVAALVSLIAIILLDRLVLVAYPVYPTQNREVEIAAENSKKALAAIAAIKLLLGVGVLGLCVFVEYEHENVASADNRYIKIALDHISAMLCICSAVVDLFAVAIAMSIIAAVWTLKTVEQNTFPFYKNDLKFYYLAKQTNDPSVASVSSPRYIIIVCHGVLIGCFGLLFILSCLSALATGSFLQSDYLSLNQRAERGLSVQGKMFSALHILWAAGFMGLVILGLLDLSWRGEFIGGDLLWVSILFFVTGALTSNNHSTMLSTKFVLNIVCLGISVEKLCASVNLIYQYSSYPIYTRGPERTFIGQIVLVSIQTGLFGAEALTSLASSVIFGRALSRLPSSTYRHSNAIHTFFALGTLFYAVVITGCYVVFELGKWRYNEVPIDVPFFRLGNGPLAGAVFIVQLVCVCYPRLLAASTLLHIIVAAIAHFTISSAMTNTFYLYQLLHSQDIIRASTEQETIFQVAIILAAGATLACAVATFCGTICALRSSYILHHKSASTNSTVVAPLEENFGSLRYNSMAPPPGTSPLPIQPMEEQSVYWSADENPFYYHTSKRFYGQPYQIESGFYGYALANPNQGVHHHRRLTSHAVQTQIGHAFEEER